jgi:hypothetical protein
MVVQTLNTMKMILNLDVQKITDYCKMIGNDYTYSVDLQHSANIWLVKDVRCEIDVPNFPISNIKLLGSCDTGFYAGNVSYKQELPDEFLTDEVLNKLADKNYFITSTECTLVTSVETLDNFSDLDFTVHKNETTGEILSVDVRYKFDFDSFLEAWKAQDFPEMLIA